MSNTKFGLYSGEEFMSMKLEPRKFIIDRYLKEKDSVILVGEEKAGKSLCIMQMICSLTTQHPFLDKYEVFRPCKVSYIQIEGELEDSQDRFKRMTDAIDFDPNMFQILFSQPLELQDAQVTQNFINMLRPFSPDIVIIDPIYFAFSGDLSDNLAVRNFLGNIRIIKEALNCTMLMSHHTHNMKFDKHGNLITEGDNAIFGSKFFKAWADHILFLAYDKKNNVRILSCSTQRAGDVQKNARLVLKEPSPLYFEEIDENPTREAVILNALMKSNSDGLTEQEIENATNLGHTTVYKSLKKLRVEGVVRKTVSRPVKYYYEHNKK